MLVLMLMLAWGVHAVADASGDAGPGTTEPAASYPSSEPGAGQLKQQVRIVVETNAPPGLADNPAAAPKAMSFHWDTSWKGWDGLHLGLSRKTRLDDPWASTGTNVLGTETRPVLRLEELRMTAKIGAKFAVDGAVLVTDDAFTDFDNGVELRRARLYAKGDCLLVLPVSYQLEIGYIPNELYIEESYLSFRGIPWIGELKAGQYQAPMGLDVITGSRDITFMEPAAPLQALAPGVNAGAQVGRPVWNQRATWRLGLFTDGVGKDFGDAARDYGRAIVRFTGLPFCPASPGEPAVTRLLHVGVSANLLYSGSSTVRYRSRPESHLAPYVVDTGDLEAGEALVLGTEAAWVNGPFSLQGEYLHSWVREENGEVPGFDGVYAAASWFLTGESRRYDQAEGMFGRVFPKRNFALGQAGWGAWEVAARYSFVNLNSADVEGGRLSMGMVGLNWYPHSHVKWRFDCGTGHASGRAPEGNVSVFQTRVEVDF